MRRSTTTDRAHPRRRRRRWPWIVAGLVVLLVLGTLHALRRPGPLKGTVRAPHGASAVRAWMSNAAPVAWDGPTNRIIFNRRGSDGLFDAYTVDPDGRHVSCLTCRRPWLAGAGAATHRGASDLIVHDGRSYVLLVVERGRHPGKIGDWPSEPGKGRYDELWIETLDGRRAWRLTGSGQGAIWPRFDRTGNRIVWAQMKAGASLAHPLGQWQMNLAPVDWSGGAPRLGAVRTFDPESGKFYEPYGFSPDNRRILFASDVHVAGRFLAPSATNAQIWTVGDDLDPATLQRVSPGGTGGMFSNYNEFAAWVPGTDRILLARTKGSGAHGLDYWTVGPDGSDPVRVTYLNDRKSNQYQGYSVLGGFAFDPRDPRRLVAGVSHDLRTKNIDALMITIGPRGLR